MNKEQLLANDYCPDCAKELDTGCECTGCGKDWLPEIQSLYAQYGLEENARAATLRLLIDLRTRKN